MKEINPETEVHALLESIEISASCPDCGRLSLAILNNTGCCPHCENLRMIPRDVLALSGDNQDQ